MIIDATKIIGTSPKDTFEAIDKMNKAHQELIDALFLLKRIIDNEKITESCYNKINNFLIKFSKDETITTR